MKYDENVTIMIIVFMICITILGVTVLVVDS